MQKVAIAGVGQTRTKLKRRDVNFPELIGEACDLALEDAGLSEEDIDGTVKTKWIKKNNASPEHLKNIADKWVETGVIDDCDL